MGMLDVAVNMGLIESEIFIPDRYQEISSLAFPHITTWETQEYSDYTLETNGPDVCHMYNGTICFVPEFIAHSLAVNIGLVNLNRMTNAQWSQWYLYCLDTIQSKIPTKKGQNFGYSFNLTNNVICYRYHAHVFQPYVTRWYKGIVVIYIPTRSSTIVCAIDSTGVKQVTRK